MSRALLSAFLHDLLDNLTTSQTKDFLKRFKYLRKLKAALLSIDALVDDAEEKQFSKGGDAVKRWLNDVQHALYYLEELLVEITTKSLGRKLQLKHEIHRLLSSKKLHAEAKEMKVNIHNMIESLEALAKKKDALALKEGVTWKGVKESVREFPPCSLVLDNYFYGNYPKDYFYGREEEEKSILESLLSNRESGGNVKVINIMGTPGAGKTGFADLIYFNHKVREYFEVRAWVNVPYKVSVSFVAKKILEAISQEFIPGNDFELLRKRLQDFLAGKKILIVLDDCRIEDDSIIENWTILISSLEASARGSAIILTVNPDDDPLVIPPAIQTLHLGVLSQENCWSIFLVHAFGNRDLHEFPELEAVGKEIVNRLGNLPLAAKMVGSLLQDKLYLHEWVQILRSKLLNASEDNLPIPPFLILCYLDLPAELKRCFAYLSLFPKGYEFKQKEVVPLWMAQGFLHQQSKSNGKSMEEIGDEYFGYLIMRSFLQPLGAGVSFLMHNLVHDLAIYIFGESSKHHLSYSTSIKDFPNTSLNQKAHLLRTILPVYLPLERAPRQLHTSVLEKALLQLNPQIFRVLSLYYYDITDLPASIGNLSHLCYLDLSHTALETLPDSIGDLVNLQTLLLVHCAFLTSFPQTMGNLINLRCLDVRDSGVQEMPSKMNRLTSLQTLTSFVVSKSRPRFEDLAGLSNLKTLTISKLQNVIYPTDASYAKLKGKNSLDDLMLQWDNGDDHEGNEREVLENLEPHTDLKSLIIEYYDGRRFPSWLGYASFWALQLVDLRHCENCVKLPTLGQLPFLKELFIEGFNKVSSVGHEFYGTMTASYKPFQSLQNLQFRDMLEWKEWNVLEGIEFPCLFELYIIRCPKLIGNLPKELPSLEKLEISGCHDLVSSLPKVSNTCAVFVNDSNEILMRNVAKIPSHASLRRVTISQEIQEFTPQSYSGFPSTKYTVTSSVSEIEEIGHEAKMENESTATRLLPPDPASSDTSRIPELKELSSGLLSSQVEADVPNVKQEIVPQSSLAQVGTSINKQASVPLVTDALKTATDAKIETSTWEDSDEQRSSFEILKVSNISQLKRLPRKLQSLKIEGCESLEALPDGLSSVIPTLQELYLINCSSLKSFPYPASLRTLYIRNCRRLEFLPLLESRENLASLDHLCIGSSCDSLTTFALNLFPELKILCIWDCPNLVSLYISEGFLGNLGSLESLEIRDCPRLMSFVEEGLPAPNLSSLFLTNCKNLKKLPTFMTSLTSLQSLFLHRCPELESFPFGGLPSSLSLLSIAFCDKLTPQKDWGLHRLQSLNRLELEGGCIGMESFPEEKLLPSNINSLHISTLKNLHKLDYKGLQHMKALQTLEIYCCDKLKSLPEEGLPSSLTFLCIKEAPLLTPRIKPKKGKDWHKIAHIPHIQIDDDDVISYRHNRSKNV